MECFNTRFTLPSMLHAGNKVMLENNYDFACLHAVTDIPNSFEYII